MKTTEKLRRAYGTLMTVNSRTDFDLEPTCKLLRQAAAEIEALRGLLTGTYSDEYVQAVVDQAIHASEPAGPPANQRG